MLRSFWKIWSPTLLKYIISRNLEYLFFPGIPVSSTHCAVGAVLFVGMTKSTSEGVDWKVFGKVIEKMLNLSKITIIADRCRMVALLPRLGSHLLNHDLHPLQLCLSFDCVAGISHFTISTSFKAGIRCIPFTSHFTFRSFICIPT